MKSKRLFELRASTDDERTRWAQAIQHALIDSLSVASTAVALATPDAEEGSSLFEAMSGDTASSGVLAREDGQEDAEKPISEDQREDQDEVPEASKGDSAEGDGQVDGHGESQPTTRQRRCVSSVAKAEPQVLKPSQAGQEGDDVTWELRV